MNRVENLRFLSEIFRYKVIKDENDTEYILYQSNKLNNVCNIVDKTAFEAVENHYHIMDRIKRKEINDLIPIAENIGELMLVSLKQAFPSKKFIVFVSIGIRDSLIIRFHQKWEGEEPYYDLNGISDYDEKILRFEG